MADPMEAAAKALWEAQRKQEISALAELVADTSYLRKAAELMHGSDLRTQVMVGFSAVSKSLGIGLRAHLSNSTERDRKEMFEGLGPLASDASKLRLARLMGWMPSIVSSAVQSLRQARNLVAHDIVDASQIPFPSNLTKEAESYLDARIASMLNAANSSEGMTQVLVADDPHKVARYALLLAFDILECVVWGPAKLRLGIGPTTRGMFNHDEAPEWVKTSTHNLAWGVLLLSGLTPERSANTD